MNNEELKLHVQQGAQIRVGDTVLIVSREDAIEANSSPVYTREMEKYAGKRFRVSSIDTHVGRKRYTLENGYNYRAEWLVRT